MARTQDFGFMRWLDVLTTLLLVLGGLLWGLGGVFGIEMITSAIAKLGVFGQLLYILVGLSAVYEIIGWKAIFRRWNCSILISSPGGSTT